MRQYIKPEISVEAIEKYSLMAGTVINNVDNTGGNAGGGVNPDDPNKPFGSKDGFPWSDDFDFHMD